MNAMVRFLATMLVGVVAWAALAANAARGVDIKRAAPVDAHMAIYAHRNPERDYQRRYLTEAWQTVKDERIFERIVAIAASRAPAEKMAQGRNKVDEVKAALEPVNWQALAHADEFVVAQAMLGPIVPTNNTLFVAKVTTEDAAGCELGVVRLFELVKRWSDGKIGVATKQIDGTTVTMLELPAEAPFQPAVARFEDLILVSSSASLLDESVAQLHDGSLPSKFDDPRLAESLSKLPAYEDSVMFLDGRQLFARIRAVADVVREKGKDDPKAVRLADLMKRIVDQAAILDYQTTVEYTEPGQNRGAVLGKLVDGYQETVLGRAVSHGQAIEDWQRWIPADATAFSLSAGISFHELYEGSMKFVREQIPEAEKPLAAFVELQAKIGVNLDEDILQSFSGESLSVSVPVAAADGKPHHASVMALKCQNPDKTRELVGRAVETLGKVPALRAQQLKLMDSQELAGFQEVQAAFCPVLGVKPVIGFSEGWMIVSCSPAAVEKVLAVRSGKAPSIDSTANFARLGLDATGPVWEARYGDIGASVRRTADTIDKIGVMAPMLVGLVGAQARPEDLKTMQDAVGLLPSFGKVVRKMDFFERQLSVTRQGPLAHSYLKESVVEVRQPKE